MMLTVEGLSKRFGGFLAVNQVSFEVREGEILGLIGPKRLGQEHDLQSYCGKSAPDVGVGPPARQGNRRFAGLRHLPQRGRAHLSDSTALPQTFASRKRDARSLLRRRREYRARRSSAQSRRGARYGRAPIRCDSADRWAWRCRAQEARTCPCARHQAALAPGRREPGWSRLEQKWSALPNCSTISEPEWA